MRSQPIEGVERLRGALVSALALRYQVYCLERNFLSAQDYPDGVEVDEHDETASHFYAFDNEDQLVGYVRLVKPCQQSRFPFQQHCHLSEGVRLPQAHQAAEISRLMVRNDYRRRQGDGLYGVTPQQSAAAFSGDRRHEAPVVLLSLYKQMYQHCLAHGVRYWYAAMEKPLARSLSQWGFGFEAIGPSTDYYGPVAPYLGDLRRLEIQVQLRRPDLMGWLVDHSAKSAQGLAPLLPALASKPIRAVSPQPAMNFWRDLVTSPD